MLFKFLSVPPLLSITNGLLTYITRLNLKRMAINRVTDASKPNNYTKMIGYNDEVGNDKLLSAINLTWYTQNLNANTTS